MNSIFKKSAVLNSVDETIKKSLFGSEAAGALGGQSLRIHSQYYGPMNLLELRDRRTAEL